MRPFDDSAPLRAIMSYERGEFVAGRGPGEGPTPSEPALSEAKGGSG